MGVWSTIYMQYSEKSDILVRFFLENFIQFQVDNESLTQMRLIFNLFIDIFIISDQLKIISSKFKFELYDTICFLICAFECPQNLPIPHGSSFFWSKEEKLLLLTCWVKNENIEMVCSILGYRSPDACRMELKRIIQKFTSGQERKLNELHETNCDAPIVYLSKEQNLASNVEKVDKSSNYVSKQLLVHQSLKSNEQLKLQQLKFARTIKSIRSELHDEDISEDNCDFFLQNDFSIVMNDAKKNFGKQNGKRYSLPSKSFWARLMLYSRKAFSMMKEYLDGPCESTVCLWLQNEDDVPKCHILEDISQINSVFNFWKEKLDLAEDNNYTLSIDAAKIDENLSISSDGTTSGTIQPFVLEKSPSEYRENHQLYNQLWNDLLDNKMLITHIFVMLICPISTRRAFPIYIQFTNSGSATSNVTKNLDHIVSNFVSNGIKIRFISSDSDQCYRRRFNEQYHRIISTLEKGVVNLSRIPEDEILYTNDAYHCLKRLRKAMVKCDGLYMKPSDISTGMCVNKSTLQQIDPSLPNCIFRSGSMMSMDDYYPSALFRWKTLKRSLEYGNYAVTCYLWIGVLARKVMSNKKITRLQRCMMCYMGLHIVIYYKMIMEKWKADNIYQNFISKMIISPDLCVDFANFFASMIKALTTIPESFPLSRVSSILSEHFFSRIRNNAGNNQTADAVRSAINKIEFIDSFRSNPNFDELNHRRRLETATVESGITSVDDLCILKCRDFAQNIFHSAGIFEYFGAPLNDLLMRPIYTDPDTLLSELFDNTIRNKEEAQKTWKLNASQFHVNGRYGRNIKARYVTAAKPIK